MSLLLERPSWQRHAACRGRPELFFVTLQAGQTLRSRAVVARFAAALELCAACPVRRPCFELGRKLFEADPHSTSGSVWGGVIFTTDRRPHFAGEELAA